MRKVLALVSAALFVTGFQVVGPLAVQSASAAAAVSISGPTVATSATVTLTGIAAPRAQVKVYFHRIGEPAGYYSLRRVLTADSAGRFRTTYDNRADQRYYAVSGGVRSATKLTRAAYLTISGPGSATKNSRVTLKGRGPAYALVYVRFHRLGTAAGVYNVSRAARVNSVGEWSTSFVLSTDHRYYVTYLGHKSTSGLTQAKTPATSAPGGFPNASTTGVPRGTTLRTYTGPCSIQTANAVIDAKIV